MFDHRYWCLISHHRTEERYNDRGPFTYNEGLSVRSDVCEVWECTRCCMVLVVYRTRGWDRFESMQTAPCNWAE